MPRTGSQELPQFGNHALWLLPFLALVVWQGWMTLGLFDVQQNPARLLDERPLLSGRHPLHLYHGYLGAASLLVRGYISCFDPSFHAGYPKTPVFDAGDRPAQLAMVIGGGRLRPGAYKLAVALVCAGVPLLLWIAARGVGLSRLAALFGCCLGVAVWWGGPCRESLHAGEMDLLVAGLLTVAQSGLLIAYHRNPGVLSFLGVVFTGFLGWFSSPVFMLVLLPPFFVYYLSAGPRHRLAWHLSLFGGLLGAILANYFWLVDWFRYSWIRVPLRLEMPTLAHRTFRTVWQAPLWGCAGDRTFLCILIISGLVGLGLFNWTAQRATARLFGLAGTTLLILAVFGVAAEPVGRFGAARLVVPGMLFAIIPAAHCFAEILRGIRYLLVNARLNAGNAGTAGLGTACLMLPCFAVNQPCPTPNWTGNFRKPEPLQIGLNEEQKEIVEFLNTRTTGEARILWEDRKADRTTSRWTALLPVLTGRSFVGGLDADAGIEHTYTGLSDARLADQEVSKWTDDQLRDYCERYNIGWVVCWTPASIERFQAWCPDAEPMAELHDAGTARVFALKRRPNFALTGSARWLRADAQHIVLEDVRPVNGQVVLSMHFDAGLRVSPSRVRIEKATTYPRDPIALVRLVVKDPVARVTITWERP